MPIARSRLVFSIIAMLVLAAGLLSRSRWQSDLPPFVAAYAGDTLWSLLLYLVLCIVLTRLQAWKVALATLLFTFGVEFSQLYQADWINAVRQHKLGALALGKSFVWADLPCYAAGVVLGVGVDVVWIVTQRRSKPVAESNE